MPWLDRLFLVRESADELDHPRSAVDVLALKVDVGGSWRAIVADGPWDAYQHTRDHGHAELADDGTCPECSVAELETVVGWPSVARLCEQTLLMDGVGELSRRPPPATVDAERVADDDRLRSNYVRELLWEAAHDTPSPPANGIPTTIMQFWDNASAIPADVSECLESWRSAAAAAGLTYILFDDASAERCIASSLGSAFADAFTRCPHPAMRSDYFRLCYIFRYGGLYVDADDVYKGVELRSCFDDGRLKVQPLCYDVLSDGMVPAEVFREPQESASSWIFYVNNNPLVAPPFHPIVRLALAAPQLSSSETATAFRCASDDRAWKLDSVPRQTCSYR